MRLIPRTSSGRQRRLIVTADDFGLAEEINEAVEIAHRRGILSSASLMVAGPAAADAIARARRLPSLRVGLHVVLLEQKPALPPEQIARLVDSSGHMRCDLVRLAFELVGSSKLRSQLRNEIEAQFAAFRAIGLRLDHVDVHKHYHLHPIVGHEVVAAARRFGACAIRVPFEPVSVIRRVEKKGAKAGSVGIACWAGLLRRLVRKAGLHAPDAAFGLAWSGQFTAKRLLGLLHELPGGVIEIYMHPGMKDRFRGSASRYRYSDELKALCAPEIIAEVKRSGLQPIGYSDLHL